jgi:hypothetical protein
MRFGHVSHDKIVALKQLYPAIKCNKSSFPCDVCHYDKQKHLPFPQSFTSSANLFDLIHVDIWGPVPTSSILGHRYFLTIVEDKSRYTLIYLMKQKSETSNL